MFAVENLREEDLQLAHQIEREVFSHPWGMEDFRALIDNDRAFFLVAKANGKVVGNLVMRIILDEAEITNVAVKKEYRGQGIAKALLQHALVEGERKGVVAYTLEVRESNMPAISLYQSHGFINEGKRKEFYQDPVEDAIIMWKRS